MSENVTRFVTGAVRSADAYNVRFDLVTPLGLRRLNEEMIRRGVLSAELDNLPDYRAGDHNREDRK